MNSSFSTYWRELANGNRNEPRDRFLILLLAPLSIGYSLIQSLRAFFYKVGLLRSRCLPRPVISIGNITVGGTGKTPVTAYIARWLLQQRYKVAVLSRGYGGSLEGQTIVVSDGATIMVNPGECGDEPFLLASTIPGLMVVIGTDRHAAGMLAMQQLDPDVFLLDDGFQHLRLQRDLNILLLDHSHPYGNGWTLPSGMLREPIRAGKRADLIIHTRCPNDVTDAPFPENTPCCNAHHHIVDLLPLSGGNPISLPGNDTGKVLAFTGIAEPTLFFNELESLGLNLVHTIRFPDHTSYTGVTVSELRDAMRQYGAEVAITTEKDGVKLRGLFNVAGLNILLARLELVISDPAPMLDQLSILLQKKQ